MKKIFLLVYVCALATGIYAQCSDCQADYCYNDSLHPEYCIRFKLEKEGFELIKGKKTRTIALSDTLDFDYFVFLAENRKYKLTALELLLIQQSLMQWKVKKREVGMTYTDSGLGIRMVTEGDGAIPEDGQTVSVHYTGTLADGTKFDSSYDRGTPFSFVLGEGRVIKGWDEGIKLLGVGSKAVLRIPPELGYGARGAGGVIPPNATIYFEVELIEIK
jgi:FKBP-type peptidyl-prolyl cis-trans isomerase